MVKEREGKRKKKERDEYFKKSIEKLEGENKREFASSVRFCGFSCRSGNQCNVACCFGRAPFHPFREILSPPVVFGDKCYIVCTLLGNVPRPLYYVRHLLGWPSMYVWLLINNNWRPEGKKEKKKEIMEFYKEQRFSCKAISPITHQQKCLRENN